MVKVVNFVILDTFDDIVALVVDKVPKEVYKKVNEAIKQAYQEVKKVGFLTLIENDGVKIWKLEMADGEFCKKTSKAFALYLYSKKLVDKTEFLIMSSGNEDILKAKIVIQETNDGDKVYYSQVEVAFKRQASSVMSTGALIKKFLKKRDYDKMENDIDINTISHENTQRCLINKERLQKLKGIDTKKDNIVNKATATTELKLNVKQADENILSNNETINEALTFVCVKSENSVHNENSFWCDDITRDIQRCYTGKTLTQRM